MWRLVYLVSMLSGSRPCHVISTNKYTPENWPPGYLSFCFTFLSLTRGHCKSLWMTCLWRYSVQSVLLRSPWGFSLTFWTTWLRNMELTTQRLSTSGRPTGEAHIWLSDRDFQLPQPSHPFPSLWPMTVSLQSPSQVLGQHPEEPSVRSGCSGDRQHRRRSVCHRSDLHRLLHHLWAQSGTGKNSVSRSAWLCISFGLSILFSRLHGYFFSNQDSPVNKLLYAREIPRYKQLVERWDSFLSPLFNS